MNNAIMAVTKSAYATFHAPPWWPAWPPFFLITMMGAVPAMSGKRLGRRSGRCRRCSVALILNGLLSNLEAWTHVRRNGSAAVLHRHARRRAFHERDDDYPHHVIIGVLLIYRFGHGGCDWADQSVAQQNPKKRTDKRGGNLVTNLFRRAAQSAHSNDHAKHRGDDAQPRQGIGHRGQRRGWQQRALVVHIHIQLHHLIDVEWLNSAAGGHADGVANKIQGVMLF